jgi:CHAT domain-containing protein
VGGAETRSVVMALGNLAGVAFERGDLAAAEEWQQRGLALAKEMASESLDIAKCLSHLGQIAQARGDLAAAQGFQERALAMKEKLSPDTLVTAESLSNLAEVARERGDHALAEQLQRRALAIGERLAPEGYKVATYLFSLGEVALARGELAQAEEHLRRALAIRAKLGPGSTAEALTLHRLGLVSRAAGRSEATLDWFLRALDSLESQSRRLGATDEVRSGFTGRYGVLYQDAVETLVDQGRLAQAVHVLERYRARSLLAMLAERDILFAADVPTELAGERRRIDAEYDSVQAKISGLSPGKQAAEIETQLTRLRELRRSQEDLAARIRQASPRYASLQYPEPLDLEHVRGELDPGTVLLTYSVGAERTLLFAVQATDVSGPGVTAVAIPVRREALRAEVEAFRRAVQSPEGDQAALIRHARELYERLVRPAEAQIAGSRRLVFALDGPLHSLPFAALVRGEGEAAEYLVEWKPLHVVPSATVYAELRRSRPPAASAAGTLVAFGDPAYPALATVLSSDAADPTLREVTRSLTLATLPATRQEVENIVRRFPGRSRKYLGVEATEERAKSVGPEVRYVHFACHGYLDERLPLNSALALTVPEKAAAGADNGLLQAWEIFDQVRIDADLVTLSACDTALGREMGGEGLLGLARAFFYAGARSVLATLWGVPDTSTALFMDRFYAHLGAGQSRDEALRSAQIDFIRGRVRGKGRDLTHPFRWAAHQLSGSVGESNAASSSSP